MCIAHAEVRKYFVFFNVVRRRTAANLHVSSGCTSSQTLTIFDLNSDCGKRLLVIRIVIPVRAIAVHIEHLLEMPPLDVSITECGHESHSVGVVHEFDTYPYLTHVRSR